MKFRYQYRTKDNEVRSGEIAAVDRDAAYAELKTRGIKPSRMDEAPGFFNKVLGKGKRWLAIGALAIAAAVAVVGWLLTEREVEEATRIVGAVPRHQIYGDPELVAKFDDFTWLLMALGNEGDAVLACFARPGRITPMGPDHKVDEVFESAMKGSQPVVATDPREIRELKQIVNWIRAELIEYVDNPADHRDRKMKFRSYYQRLFQRSSEEKRIYTMIEQELQKGVNEQVRAERNAKLRKLGLPPILSEDK